VLQVRKAGTRGVIRQAGGVIWYPVRDIAFLTQPALAFPQSVLQGQHRHGDGTAALLHVFVPTAQPGDSAGSAQAGTPVPGLLQLPGLWQQVVCMEVTVRISSCGPRLHRPGRWPELQHLADHYMLAMSAVSNTLLCSALHC
jgi:hypothetical protein